MKSLKNAEDEFFAKHGSCATATISTWKRTKRGVRQTINHMVHHRGQLSVYLRLNDIPVPPIYGPSADEGQM